MPQTWLANLGGNLRHIDGITQSQKEGPSPRCSATSQLPKAPVSLGDTSSIFKAKPKSIMHCKIHQGKACSLQKKACEKHTEEHTQAKCNCVTSPMCTSHPIPLHLKQRRKHWVSSVILDNNQILKHNFKSDFVTTQ